ncbi:MAG: zinc metallopeptidase [Candidatus Polarisedimenticolaceae bacterium]|nr:zinc metallopeptidase [Candidatus Polarisedimenticolaceae bacterium]
MIYAIGTLAFLLLIYGPHLWVRFTLKRYSQTIDDMPGTGGELARHLVKRFELEGVVVESTKPMGDHFDPANNAVRLSPDIFDGKSLTAIAVAAHEVGHAIQFNRKEPVSKLRLRYMGRALTVQRLGAAVLMMIPVVTLIFKVPHAALLTGLIGVLTMLASVFMYVAILPEEFDASFNKALPILIEGEYINESQIEPVRRILKACAFTYVAAALADILRLWRWLAILRR